MSKSAGNFFTVRDISEKVDLMVLRFFMLSAHYRNPVNFSEELVDAAKNGLDRITTAVDTLTHMLKKDGRDEKLTDDEAKLLEE